MVPGFLPFWAKQNNYVYSMNYRILDQAIRWLWTLLGRKHVMTGTPGQNLN